MRLKRNKLRTFYHRAAIPSKDSEGNSYMEYGPPFSFEAEEWPGGGKHQTEMYGIRLPNIRNIRIEGNYKEMVGVTGTVGFVVNDGLMFTVNDGICLYTDEQGEPDYKIVAIYPYRFLTMELERI